MEKIKNKPGDYKLIDPARRGTIIIGNPRFGTHFAQNICRQRAYEQGLDVIQHGEIVPHRSSKACVLPGDLPGFLSNVSPNQYRLIIINHEEHKIPIADNTTLLDDWHVLRIDDDDKYRWFWSWFWFMHSPLVARPMYPELMTSIPKPGMHSGRTVWIDDHDGRLDFYDTETHAYLFTKVGQITHFDEALREVKVDRFWGHHGTARELYDRFLSQVKKKLRLSLLLPFLPSALNNHLFSKIVPADEEIQYKGLVFLQNQEVAWQPNHYPDIDPAQIFDHGDLLRAILDRWDIPFPGHFKEPK